MAEEGTYSRPYDVTMTYPSTRRERDHLLTSEEVHRMRPKGSDIPSKDYDSLDYDNCYNVPYKNALKTFSKKTYLQMEVMRWVLVGFIGVFTGVVALFIDVCVRYLFRLKFSLFEKVYHATVEEGNVITAFLLLLGFNVLFAIIASAFIVIEPVAAGSGIPEIKCYLNGIKVPHVTRLTTLVSKAVGVLFSVSGGFFVGKEGPMIHSGAIVGAGLPQFRSMFFKFINLPYHFFRSDREKRDFVSSGAAAGVAGTYCNPLVFAVKCSYNYVTLVKIITCMK
jgi:chloride channel 6